MKLKQEFVTPAPGEALAFLGIVRNNETAAFVAERLRRETTPEAVIAELYAVCDDPIGLVTADVKRVLDVLRGIGALDE